MKLLVMLALWAWLTHQAFKTKTPGYCFWCGWAAYAIAFNLFEESGQ